jgi:hypothetical protein
MLIHCNQDCTYQKDGYCMIDSDVNARLHYMPNGCVRCIQTVSRTDYESGKGATPVELQMHPEHF